MPPKPTWTTEQKEVLHATALRVWKAKFKDLRKDGDRPGGQEAMALALGLSQQSVSALLKGTYVPGIKIARNLANLDGKTLEQLVGDFEDDDVPLQPGLAFNGGTFANLDVCVRFFASTKHWSPWTIAAAKAGFFGNADFAPPEWAIKLDHLEKALERARKA